MDKLVATALRHGVTEKGQPRQVALRKAASSIRVLAKLTIDPHSIMSLKETNLCSGAQPLQGNAFSQGSNLGLWQCNVYRCSAGHKNLIQKDVCITFCSKCHYGYTLYSY